MNPSQQQYSNIINQSEQSMTHPSLASIAPQDLSNPFIQGDQVSCHHEHRIDHLYKLKIVHLILCVTTIIFCFETLSDFGGLVMSIFLVYGFYNILFHTINDKQKVEELKKKNWICAFSAIVFTAAIAQILYCCGDMTYYREHFRDTYKDPAIKYQAMSASTSGMMLISSVMFYFCVLNEKKMYRNYHPDHNINVAQNDLLHNNHHHDHKVKSCYKLKFFQILTIFASTVGCLFLIINKNWFPTQLIILLVINGVIIIYQCIGELLLWKILRSMSSTTGFVEAIGGILLVFCVATEGNQAQDNLKFMNPSHVNQEYQAASNHFIPAQNSSTPSMPVQQKQISVPQESYTSAYNMNQIPYQQIYAQPALINQQQYYQVQPHLQQYQYQMQPQPQHQMMLNQHQQLQQQPLMMNPHQNVAQEIQIPNEIVNDNQQASHINNNKMV
eukprot:403340934